MVPFDGLFIYGCFLHVTSVRMKFTLDGRCIFVGVAYAYYVPPNPTPLPPVYVLVFAAVSALLIYLLWSNCYSFLYLLASCDIYTNALCQFWMLQELPIIIITLGFDISGCTVRSSSSKHVCNQKIIIFLQKKR